MTGKEVEIDDSLFKALIESLYNTNDCPCCCHHEEAVECVNEHGASGCCVVSEYEEIDRCCEEAGQ